MNASTNHVPDGIPCACGLREPHDSNGNPIPDSNGARDASPCSACGLSEPDCLTRTPIAGCCRSCRMGKAMHTPMAGSKVDTAPEAGDLAAWLAEQQRNPAHSIHDAAPEATDGGA